MDCRIIEVVRPGVGKVRDLPSSELSSLNQEYWVLVDGVSLRDIGPEGENRLRAAVDALEDAVFAKLAALLEELGNLNLERAEVFFRKQKEIWEIASGDPEFLAANTFTTVAELAAAADPENGLSLPGV
ncbi:MULTISPECIES: hypothetical protein [Rhizobium]|uniref:Uncharacterized protein n=1 Tax=Rhizobium johnstonii (strain DSM 114642 / LMG 32736 / 3841) TaxID=216596 RepID=Q1MHB0_RHIJ3|nr:MULTISPECIES: hypothetical protein [Rhizobium]MBY3249906.1 hypothetical protein [Rhizobium laguerreae]MBY3531058.1 hypothetical protein [Rhizobium laguerreae]NEI92362.1 hypothetical protein [Rhizobium leguminosarum]NEJ79118.1 hypothetical protein [Rhizobium leguminosarum]CAK07655.1 hypothetical protein RL2163 [Rhizobium johnstonii 3841]